MPKIVWPEQPERIREACRRHGVMTSEVLRSLLACCDPPRMRSQVARAFLRCFYAARDLERAERDLSEGGPHTEAFAAATMERRVAELRRHLAVLEKELATGTPTDRT